MVTKQNQPLVVKEITFYYFYEDLIKYFILSNEKDSVLYHLINNDSRVHVIKKNASEPKLRWCHTKIREKIGEETR